MNYVFNRQAVVLCTLFFITLFLSLATSDTYEEFEGGVYSAYAKSIIQDGDLNIINQMSEETRWLVTKRYHHPIYHDHGISIIWLPFYFYDSFIEKDQSIILYIVNIFMVLISCLLIIDIFKKVFSCKRSSAVKIVIISVFSLPTYWVTFIFPLNSELPTLFLSSILLYLVINFNYSKMKKSSFLLGAYLGYCLTAKVHMYFYIPFVLLPFLKLVKHARKKEAACYMFYLLIGSLALYSMYALNIIERYGFFKFPYTMYKNSTTFFIPFISMFYPGGGLIHASPVLFVLWLLIPIIVLYVFKKRGVKFNVSITTFLIALSFIMPLFHTFLFTFRFFMSQPFFPMTRHLAVFTPLFAINIGYLFFYVEKNCAKFKYILYAVFTLVIGWNLCFSYYIFFKEFAITGETITLGSMSLKQYSDVVVGIVGVVYKIIVNFTLYAGRISQYLPVIIVMFGIIFFCLKQKSARVYNILTIFAFLTVITYTAVTGLNLINSKKNVKILRAEGFFKDKVVASGECYIYYDEIIDIVDLSLRYYDKYPPGGKLISKIKTYRDEYLTCVKSEIYIDPIGFKKRLNEGVIRSSYWDMNLIN